MMATNSQSLAARPTLYSILGVGEVCSTEDLTRAYRQKALQQHPDKGGDADRFNLLKKAYGVLSDGQSRQVYDDDLARARDRATLVEGGRPVDMDVCGTTTTGLPSGKQAQAPLRAKTEPQHGSKRQMKMRCSQPGKPMMACAAEWKGMGSGISMLKMLTDNGDVSDDKKTQQILDKYVALPRGKEMKKKWVGGLRGKEKQDLKAAAKKLEEAERAKWANWAVPAPPPAAKVIR